MPAFELKNIDPEDVEEVLVLVEHSFNIRFESNELAHLSTFGQLCDHITAKISLDHSSSCTSQQAFYMLRQAVAGTQPIGSGPIAPTTLLADVLPRHNRRHTVRQIERSLGFPLNLLGPPDWLLTTLILTLLVSLASLLISGPVGVAGILLTILGFQVADRFASNTLRLQTVGQAARQLTRENYLQVRRNPHTFNRAEVGKVLTDLFSTELALDEDLLRREARFV